MADKFETTRRDQIMEQHLRKALERVASGDFHGAQRNIEYARNRMADLIGSLTEEPANVE